MPSIPVLTILKWVKEGKVRLNGECWEWHKAHSYNGYATLKGNHRTVYIMCVGEIPDGYIVHHKCENKRCINPDHLEVMTGSEHMELHRNARITKWLGKTKSSNGSSMNFRRRTPTSG